MTSKPSNDESPDGCGGGKHPTLKNEFHDEVSSNALGIPVSPGPPPASTSAAVQAGGHQRAVSQATTPGLETCYRGIGKL